MSAALGSRRDDVVIATKFGQVVPGLEGDAGGDAAADWKPDSDHLEELHRISRLRDS